MASAFLSHYRLLGLLGVGGMGEVHRAEDTRLRREVAIKILHPEAAASREWLSRFRREARLASALQHPHICTIHELGEHEGQAFIVMERLEGVTVRELIEDGPMAPARVVALARQVADALDAAHRRGIIHRDIKPANLFVTEGDHVKVLDFGLARLTSDEMTGAAPSGSVASSSPESAGDEARGAVTAARPLHLTQTGMAMGTVFYMSPEQARGEPLDARTDLFSLGSVLYEMATGRRAFEGDEVSQVLGRITHGVFVPPRALNPGVPRALDAIIVKLLAADPRQRYQRASELAADLARADAPSGATPRSPADEREARARRADGWRKAGVVASVLLVAGSVAYAWYSRRPVALTDRDSIVIGAFENTTGNPVFDDTLVTALKVQLGQSPFLDIVPDQRIAETLRLMGRRADERLTHDVARETCQRLGVKAMIDGRLAPFGTHYVLAVAATDCRTGETIAQTQAEAESSEAVLTALGGIASEMRTRLGESLPSLERFDTPIAQATTPSLPALKAYALGLEERRRGRELESLAFLKQAIELDPHVRAGARHALDRVRRARRTRAERASCPRGVRAPGSRQRTRTPLHPLPVPRPRHGQPGCGRRDAAGMAGRVPARLRAGQRAGGGLQPARAVRQGTGRRQRGHAPQPGASVCRLEPRRGLSRTGSLRRGAAHGRGRRPRDAATMPTRRLLYQLGVLAGDPSAAQHLTWARGQPREFDLVAAQAQIAMFEGRWREGESLYRRAVELALARGLSGNAAGQVAHLAWLEAIYRPGPDLGERVGRMLAFAGVGGDAPVAARFRAAAALGLAGRRDEALAIVARAETRSPESTYVRTVLAPVTRAAVALHAGRPADAVAALEPARPTETGGLGALVPIYLRAEAYRAQGAWSDAAHEYER